VALRITAIRQVLDNIQENVSAGPTGAFSSVAHHLHWLEHYHLEGKPERYAPDIADIRERDLPGVITEVESWGNQLLDAILIAAISAPWEAQHFGSAVRDAFIYLEDVLGEVGDVDPAPGLGGRYSDASSTVCRQEELDSDPLDANEWQEGQCGASQQVRVPMRAIRSRCSPMRLLPFAAAACWYFIAGVR
jgi:hypothetical protein